MTRIKSGPVNEKGKNTRFAAINSIFGFLEIFETTYEWRAHPFDLSTVLQPGDQIFLIVTWDDDSTFLQLHHCNKMPTANTIRNSMRQWWVECILLQLCFDFIFLDITVCYGKSFTIITKEHSRTHIKVQWTTLHYHATLACTSYLYATLDSVLQYFFSFAIYKK